MFLAADSYNINLLNKNQIYNVGMYLRISREDEEKYSEQSESIINQKDFLTRIIIENGWNLVDIYCDDGYTGTNFNRPAFQRMVKDIEAGRINTVITKDLSRLGRDYIETGHYIEKYFPSRNIRYIAVNDGIDTYSNSSSNDLSPFRSVINDMYAKDISKKVRTVMDSKRKNGLFIGAFAPYGYLKDPNEKGKLVINPETAPIVRRIYEMYIDGHGYTYIANALNSENIPNPTSYKQSITAFRNPRSKLGLWTHETIKVILGNPTYSGNLTQRKLSKVNYKLKQLKNLPREAWISVENTHEPVIDKDIFNQVQSMIKRNSDLECISRKQLHLLSGIIFCGDCGEKMTFANTPRGKTYCICSKYKRFNKLNLCTRHSILEEKLESYVLQDLRKISKAFLNKDKCIAIANKGKVVSKSEALLIEENKIQTRLNDIKRIIKNLYEDKIRGIIIENDFLELSQGFNSEREQLNSKLAAITRKKQLISCPDSESNELMGLIKNFTEFKNVNKAILVKLIDSIQIFEDNKIKINYKFTKP